MSQPAGRALRRLARLYGVQPGYYDIENRLRSASDDALLDVLRSLDAPVQSRTDIEDALRLRRLDLWSRGVPPVIVAWDGRLSPLSLRRPESSSRPLFRLEQEDGGVLEWALEDVRLLSRATTTVEGQARVAERVLLPGDIPLGYHRLRVLVAGATYDALVISSPLRASDPEHDRSWGAFLPLHALRTRRGWGAGDLTDLLAFARWVGDRGGRYVATLPLLATLLGTPFEPSPYSPASRLFWSEIFLDPSRAPELDSCPTAQALLASSSLGRRLAGRRDSPIVDYAQEARDKAAVLEPLARCFFEAGGEEGPEMLAFLRASPQAERYARFRAVLDRRRVPWSTWPAGLRDGEVGTGDYDAADYRRHLYTQQLLDRQLRDTAAAAAERGVRLYLDMPLGVHPDGFDVWANTELFALDVAAGAPPDPFLAKGQSWGFPPLKPTTLRERGYGYFIAAVRNHLRHAGALRLDHVMSLHRLFWVPQGREPIDGVYVRYRAEELYAILTLESRRHSAVIVGEDLGTVPGAVRSAMKRHGVRRMYVAQFELTGDPTSGLGAVPHHAVASLNTHDMPPFAAFWQGLDIEERRELGWLDDEQAGIERDRRREQRDALVAWLRAEGLLGRGDDAAAVLPALLAVLGRSEAEIVLASVEDLWGETRPQNVPGTWRERPNWRRRAAHALDEWSGIEAVGVALERLGRARESGVAHAG